MHPHFLYNNHIFRAQLNLLRTDVDKGLRGADVEFSALMDILSFDMMDRFFFAQILMFLLLLMVIPSLSVRLIKILLSLALVVI